MTTRMHHIIQKDRVAVITGAAKGIGAELARKLASHKMKLSLVDIDLNELNKLAHTLNTDTIIMGGDISDPRILQQLYHKTTEQFKDVALLINNAGITQNAGPWDSPEKWRQSLDVNFTAVLNAQHLFVPYIIKANNPAAIINLGSKEGITTPPGNAAYSVAKGAIKLLTEQLAHELLKSTNGIVSAHLLIPGYTWTPMNFPDMHPTSDDKPEEPWTAKQLVDYFIERLFQEDFYILCPDNAVTPEIDRRRMMWAVNDIILNRPALSRWHPLWKKQFAQYMNL
ncbi:Short-chain dehydrogenase (YqjQ) [Commensalibacter communis]|uniref:SDR family NAD(P)-dependent oxidoreductase n=1 Tax=Commensalibacter communis TaxID=2972786 RepID=UPI0022FF83F0|nr:SDR family oxidoreductase [Commensalibacter communis]CAI3929189.1 Short-chain dehydrogenase (YqjQ) [Commensalibacter communis]CAI3930061.1 Short-chain dehydrogenase (YqjQ) [Commensalibacter communis]